MKNILFLNGYSIYSKSHFRRALRLAQRLEATLHVAHIYDFRTDMPFNAQFLSDKEEFNQWLLDEQRRESLELERFVVENTGKQNYQLIGETYVIEGSVTEEVPRLLETTNFNLVVMGMQSHSILSYLLETNLTQYMVDTAKCPLLLLPPKESTKPIKNICFATDLKPGTMEAINYGFDLSLQLDAHFQLLTVVKTDDEIATTNDRIDALQRGIHGGFSSKLYYTIEVGNAERKIRRFLSEETVDLLILTTKQRKRWIDQFKQTVTKSLVREAELPLLILKEDYVAGYRIL